MDISEWWPLLQPETRDWLIEHNGEPVPTSIASEIIAADNGNIDPRWWAEESGESLLSDEAVDWIEDVANAEEPQA